MHMLFYHDNNHTTIPHIHCLFPTCPSSPRTCLLKLTPGNKFQSVINVWCETDGEKEDRRPNGDVGIEGNSGSDGKGEWGEMVRAYVKEG